MAGYIKIGLPNLERGQPFISYLLHHFVTNINMSTKEALERQQFLAMMIQELSRQQSDDAVAFSGPPPPSDEALFRKMCFDFPEISDDALNQLATATSKHIDVLGGTGTDSVKTDARSSFGQVFCLHETFVENVVTLCNVVISAKDSTSIPQGKHKVAAALFLRVPKLLLVNSTDSFLPLICAAPNTVSWKDVIMKFQSFVALSTVSIIASGNSNAVGGVLQLLTDSPCLADLCSVVDTLGAFLAQAEQLLALVQNEHTKVDLIEKEHDVMEPAEMTSKATLGASLNLLDSFGLVGGGAKNGKNGINSIQELLQTLLNNVRNEKVIVENEHTQRLSGVVSLLKSSWLHLTFLCRDLLLLFPSLIPSKASLLFKALHKPSPEQGSVFGAKKVEFPTSGECLYVLVFSSIASHVCSDHTHSAGSVSSSVVATTQAKDFLRGYLESAGNLSTFVGLCSRMNKYSSSGTATGKVPSSLTLDVESSGFLIDAAMLYVNEPGKVRTSAQAYSSASVAVPSLVASQLLSTLLFTLLGVLQQEKDARDQSASMDVAAPSSPAMIAFAARLSRFFTLLPVGLGHSTMQITVLKYLLDFPDLISMLSNVASESAHVADGTRVGLISPVQSMGMVSSLLMAALATQLQPCAAAVPADIVNRLVDCVTAASDSVVVLLQQSLKSYQQGVLTFEAEKSSNKDQDITIEECEQAASEQATINISAEDVDDTVGKVEQTLAASKLDDSSDSESDEKPASLPFSPPSQPNALTSDTAASAVHKKIMHQHNSAMIALLSSLSEVLLVLVGEGAGGPVIRLINSVCETEKTPNQGSSHHRVRALYKAFSVEALKVLQDLLHTLRPSGVQSFGSEDMGGPIAANVPLINKAEVTRKHLKALQELLQGGTSKGD